MKLLSSIICLGALLAFNLKDDDSIVKIPIKFVAGFGPFQPGFANHGWKQLDPSSAWYKTESKIRGLPQDWNNTMQQSIWFDGRQFAFQNYKQGNLSSDFFDRLKIIWNIDLTKRPLSERPIKCFVYFIYGTDANGKIKYKIDTNNNLDFSDETEFFAVKMDWTKTDSLARHCSHLVKYESLRNGKIVEMTSPVLIVESKGIIMRAIPQHAEAAFDEYKIKIASQLFTSTDYEPAQICVLGDDKSKGDFVDENEFILLGNDIYKNLGVNIDQQQLLLKKMSRDTVIYSSQVGFKAKAFKGFEFSTQEEINLDMFKGKFLYLEFWGSWCGPCKKELPNLKKAYDSIDKSRIDFLGIAKDEAEPLAKILQTEEIKWKQILCENEDGIIDDYNIKEYPTSFLISPSGKILAKNIRGEKLLDSLNYYLSHN